MELSRVLTSKSLLTFATWGTAGVNSSKSQNGCHEIDCTGKH